MKQPEQSIVPLIEIGRTLRKNVDSFSRRVSEFENRFGDVDEDTLAIMTQASIFCWFEIEYERDFLEVCRAVGKGRPTTQYHCCQLTPKRWIEMNSYVIGVQKWLGRSLEIPSLVDPTLISNIGKWLGCQSETKEALCELFLFKLIDDLWHYASFSILGNESGSSDFTYNSFTEWYFREDGSNYIVGHPVAGADGNRIGWQKTAARSVVDSMKSKVRKCFGDSPEEGEELITHLLEETQPPCMQRFSRYLDIQIASIGCLKWRGSIPDDRGVVKNRAIKWLSQASEAARAWASDSLPQDSLEEKIHGLLGEITPRKKALVTGFLLEDRVGGWDWLVQYTEDHCLTPRLLFKNA